jgi:3',5'-cyclic AMP phosphodiesterase CpdA
MLIAQISDMHVKRSGIRLFGSLDTPGALARCVEHLNELPTPPDAVLVTGDMTNDGEATDYETLVPLLDRLAMPYYPIPGNHDDRERMRVAFQHLGLLPAAGPLCYAVEHHAIRLIALDTLVAGQPHGRLGEEQLAWLDATLAAAPHRPTVVSLHHPPFPTGIAHMDAMGLADASALGAVIAGHPQVERVACGHLHRAISVRWAGTVAVTAPGTSHQVALGLAPGDPARWVAEPPAVLLHLWQDGVGLVTHTSYVGDYGALRRFREPHVYLLPDTDPGDRP